MNGENIHPENLDVLSPSQVSQGAGESPGGHQVNVPHKAGPGCSDPLTACQTDL